MLERFADGRTRDQRRRRLVEYVHVHPVLLDRHREFACVLIVFTEFGGARVASFGEPVDVGLRGNRAAGDFAVAIAFQLVDARLDDGEANTEPGRQFVSRLGTAQVQRLGDDLHRPARTRDRSSSSVFGAVGIRRAVDELHGQRSFRVTARRASRHARLAQTKDRRCEPPQRRRVQTSTRPADSSSMPLLYAVGAVAGPSSNTASASSSRPAFVRARARLFRVVAEAGSSCDGRGAVADREIGVVLPELEIAQIVQWIGAGRLELPCAVEAVTGGVGVAEFCQQRSERVVRRGRVRRPVDSAIRAGQPTAAENPSRARCVRCLREKPRRAD